METSPSRARTVTNINNITNNFQGDVQANQMNIGPGDNSNTSQGLEF